MKQIYYLVIFTMVLINCGCKNSTIESEFESKVNEYAEFTLTTDYSKLSDNERALIPIFIEIGEIIDGLFWSQSFGDKAELDTISDPWAKKFADIHYGPWNRLDDLKQFIQRYGEKAPGAGFYPSDMSVEEFENLNHPDKKSQYTIIGRDDNGALKVTPYREYYKPQLEKIITLMNQAIAIADDPGLKKYLTERVKAFQTDDYLASDMAWMDMKESKIDFIVGPIENYEDRLFGYKAAYEAFILVKDIEWSNDLAKFVKMLPALQKELPCDVAYKKEVPGTESDLNVYDAIYYAGDCNAGSKTIAINLPNDERVHLAKGARRLQLKNSMKAKFDKIMVPISEIMVDPSQVKNVKFEAFFWNVTFHEVAHGLGIKNTVNNKGNVRQALKDQYSAWEEAKADILGLFMAEKLIEMGEITNITVEQAYTTFISGILRSVRFGAASAHGKANMMCYNYLLDNHAFSVNDKGYYLIDTEKTREAIRGWANMILKIQGTGDYDSAVQYASQNSVIRAELQRDLDKINSSGIPRDIRFIQGTEK